MVNVKLTKDLVTELTQRSGGFLRYDDLVQFTELNKCIQKLNKAQKKKQDEPPVTEREFILFNKWLAANGYHDKGNVEVHKFEAMGYGLRAKKDIKQGDLLLEIPTSVMITENSIYKTQLEDIVQKDPMLQNVPSLRLALFLVHEKINNNSFFAPYLKVLPKTFDLPFYFTLEEMCSLKGSPLRNECFHVNVMVAKQYCHIYKLLQDNPQVQSISPFSFHFSDFVWAVSCVMSRQNQIPNFEKLLLNTTSNINNAKETVMALIPLWDFANHAEGHLTTHFEGASMRAACTAMQNYKPNDQVFIYYGNRGNRELFMYSGFVTPLNKFDAISVSMSIKDVADSPALTKRKEAAFASLGLRSECTVHLSGRFVPSECILFGGILDLSDSEVTKIFGEEINSNKDKDEVLALVEKKGRTFLSSKIDAWLRAYPEDNVKEENQTIHSKNATFMWKLEKRILSETLALLQSTKELSEITTDSNPPVIESAPAATSTSTSTSTTSSSDAIKKKKKKNKKAKAKEAAATTTNITAP